MDADAIAYDLNVRRFIEDHKGWILCAGFEGVGFRARRRGGGAWVSALTLDELHALMQAA